MAKALSTYPAISFFNDVKNQLPRSIRNHPDTTDEQIKSWIKKALSRYNALYVNNDAGMFNLTEAFDFYLLNADIINIKTGTDVETRWFRIKPENFYARKLLSCQLKDINPESIEFPTGIAYVQDINIVVMKSQDINAYEPGANEGWTSLEENSSLLNALSLDTSVNTFQNVISISCLLTYYRFFIMPSFGAMEENEFIDVAPSDFELVQNYALELAQGENTPAEILQAIQDRETQIIY